MQYKGMLSRIIIVSCLIYLYLCQQATQPQLIKLIYPSMLEKQQIKNLRWPEQQVEEVQFAIPNYNAPPVPILVVSPQSPQSIPTMQGLLQAPKLRQSGSPKPKFCQFQSQNNSTSAPIPQENPREILVPTLYGFHMFVDAQDTSVSNAIVRYGTWEPEYVNLIGYIVKEADYVLNLGSQTGLEALVMAKIIGPMGRLFIFQPYSFSYNLIKKSIDYNNFTNITTIYQYGASDETTTAIIQVDELNTGSTQIQSMQEDAKNRQNPYRIIKPTKRQQIKVDLVDNLLPKDIKLNFVLIDVQKMEIKAMIGMKKVIQRSPNLVIMTQWQYPIQHNVYKNKEQTLQFLKWLEQRGYKAYLYQGGNSIQCTVGNFFYYERIQDLLKFPTFIDVFFFPATVPLPQ